MRGNTLRRWLCLCRIALLAFGCQAFLPRPQPAYLSSLYSTSSSSTTTTATTTETSPTDTIIFFSPNFHQHVVAKVDNGNYNNKTTSISNNIQILQAFDWLDEAESEHPNAQRVVWKDTPRIEQVAGVKETSQFYYDSCQPWDAPLTLVDTIHTPYKQAVEDVMDILTAKLGAPFLSYFPTHEYAFLLERIHFLVAPPPQSDSNGLWTQNGVGLTVDQAASAILALRHLLSYSSADFLQKRPPLEFFLEQLQVPFSGLQEARIALDEWLSGACPEDVASIVYIHLLGASWEQCRILLQGLSLVFVSCDLDPSWELLDGGLLRNQLSHNATFFLRQKFRLSPGDVCSMIKTHWRLGTYSADMLQDHIDTLHETFHLSSSEMKALAIRNPSILGTSKGKVVKCQKFLTKQHSKTVLQKLPAILQYNQESNLQPKLEYFQEEIGMNQTELQRVVMNNPRVLGSSLNRTIRAAVEGLGSTCHLSRDELRSILVQVPQLLTSNYPTNLQPKVRYLMDRLGLETESLHKIVVSTPRVLMHNSITSLEPKIQMLEPISGGPETLSRVLVDNPSLLLSSKTALLKRVQDFCAQNRTFEEIFSKQRKTGKVIPRRKRAVVAKDQAEKVLEVYESVEAAAQKAGTSRANMYGILKTGRLYKGFYYAYDAAAEPSLFTPPTGDTSQAPSPRPQNDAPAEEILRKPAVSFIDETVEEPPNLVLTIFVSGRTFPQEDNEAVVGKRKSGGLALYLPQFQRTSAGAGILEAAVTKCFAFALDKRTDYEKGLVVFGYKYTKPSRNRCSLYVCRDAMRLAMELLFLEGLNPSTKEPSISIDIVTDSNYVFELLQDSQKLNEWGSHSTMSQFVYEGETPAWRANLDILYPLSRTYFRLANQHFDGVSDGRNRMKVGGEVAVRVRHVSQVSWNSTETTIQELYKSASLAAETHHNRISEFSFS